MITAKDQLVALERIFTTNKIALHTEEEDSNNLTAIWYI